MIVHYIFTKVRPVAKIRQRICNRESGSPCNIRCSISHYLTSSPERQSDILRENMCYVCRVCFIAHDRFVVITSALFSKSIHWKAYDIFKEKKKRKKENISLQNENPFILRYFQNYQKYFHNAPLHHEIIYIIYIIIGYIL